MPPRNAPPAARQPSVAPPAEPPQDSDLPVVSVRAIPAPNSEYRWRAQRRWGKDPVVCQLVEVPETIELEEGGRKVRRPHPTRLTAAELRVLQSDERIVVSSVGQGGVEAVTLKDELAEAHARSARLEGELASAAEARAELGRQADAEINNLREELKAARSEIDNLRSR